ncbi:hypothetical protein [Variovorax sp. PAMC 28711]|uniref:hypothetical protein n=1 Tax=Variovorax sp. PAMC 28711 TaxID=1795631 RepID=UPI00078B3A93|nr:hypothetical protein [Variovorax sp. PAMC 28711]AMM23203.1 hypothetical protein AX767_01535 [Variovorax sp. PAMC 28711]
MSGTPTLPAQPIKIVPGDELHLTILGAPFGFNFLTGKDRQDMLAYGRAVWTAALASGATQPSEQAEEDAAVIDKLARLLAGVAIALKGDELPLHRHGYHDLPELAAKLRLEVDLCRHLYRSQATPPTGETQAVPSDAARDVLAERQRQIMSEGWTPEHDDAHDGGTLAVAAAYYALNDVSHTYGSVSWPWASEWLKDKGPRRNLVRAGALIIAEIERLDRAALATQPPKDKP